jgi:hypothetical protein
MWEALCRHTLRSAKKEIHKALQAGLTPLFKAMSEWKPRRSADSWTDFCNDCVIAACLSTLGREIHVTTCGLTSRRQMRDHIYFIPTFQDLCNVKWISKHPLSTDDVQYDKTKFTMDDVIPSNQQQAQHNHFGDESKLTGKPLQNVLNTPCGTAGRPSRFIVIIMGPRPAHVPKVWIDHADRNKSNNMREPCNE